MTPQSAATAAIAIVSGAVLGTVVTLYQMELARESEPPPAPVLHVAQDGGGQQPPYFRVWATCPKGFRLEKQDNLPFDGVTDWKEIQAFNVNTLNEATCVKD